jgi:fatty acid-binding protein DegV
MLSIAEELSMGKLSNVAVFHAEDPEIADEFSSLLREKISPQELHTWDLSPVIGTHTGPGTFGFSIYSVKP